MPVAVDHGEITDHSGNDFTDEGIEYANDHDDIVVNAARFILNLKEKYKLSQMTLDFVTHSVEELLKVSTDNIKQHVLKTLHLQGIEITPPLSDKCFSSVNPFLSLKTEYQQTKFYKENFSLIEPKTIVLGTSLRYQSAASSRQLVDVQDTFQYVPLLENLEAFLNNFEVLKEASKLHVQKQGFLSDFCDGSLYKTHPLFLLRTETDEALYLQFIVYYDDVEVNNPLGSRKGKHKLALFYYTLANFEPKYRSTLKCIQLIAVVTQPLLKEYGFTRVLQPFIDDMNKMRDGCILKVNDKDLLVKGAVLAVLADTQAAHSLGGFKVGVGFSLRRCRNCLATKESYTNQYKESGFVLRTPASYDYHCSLLSGPLAQADSVTYGVNYISALNRLQDFHVCNNQLPQDIMHIILEGVVPYTMKAMLHSYISVKRYFTLYDVNQRILHFKYSRAESKSKPTEISSHSLRDEGSLHQSASQMWNLAVYLSLMIGEQVPNDDNEWECYLLLLDILQICATRVLSCDLVDHLRVLIELYLVAFRDCYPHLNIIPKQHYMVHLPTQILKLGPLTTSWCMRMEAKNSYFKKIAQQGNFKNISLSVAKRHQRLMCANLTCDDFFEKQIVKSGETQTQLLNEPIWIQESVHQYLCVESSSEVHLSRFDWIEWQGNRYCLSDFIWYEYQDELPCFGKLFDIISVNGTVFLGLKVHLTQGINHHFHSFIVKPTDKKVLCPLDYLNTLMGWTHSLQTHTLVSSPTTFHIVTKCVVLKMNN